MGRSVAARSPATVSAAPAAPHDGAVPDRGATDAESEVGEVDREGRPTVAVGGALAAADQHAAMNGLVLSHVGVSDAGGDAGGGLLGAGGGLLAAPPAAAAVPDRAAVGRRGAGRR